jgi:hypothetical protein
MTRRRTGIVQRTRRTTKTAKDTSILLAPPTDPRLADQMISADETAGSRNQPHGVSLFARNTRARARILGRWAGSRAAGARRPRFPLAAGSKRPPSPPCTLASPFAEPLLFHLHEPPAAPLAPRPDCRSLPLEAQPLAAHGQSRPGSVLLPAHRSYRNTFSPVRRRPRPSKRRTAPRLASPENATLPAGPYRSHASAQTDRLPIHKRLPAHPCCLLRQQRGAKEGSAT